MRLFCRTNMLFSIYFIFVKKIHLKNKLVLQAIKIKTELNFEIGL